MKIDHLPVVDGDYNLLNLEEEYKSFQWDTVEKNFSWYKTRKVNMGYELIDRHTEGEKGDKIALYYKDDSRTEKLTYKEMMILTNKAGNVLKEKAKVVKGDRVFLFMPRSPELYFALIATIKIGAIVGTVFEGVSDVTIREIFEDGQPKVIVTTPELLYRIQVNQLSSVEKIILVGENIQEKGMFIDFHFQMEKANDALDIEWVDLEDGLFLHYSSEPMEKPLGYLHVHKTMIQIYQTTKWVLDLKEDDVYWCTVDPGWITGITYGVFGPWLLGNSNLVLGGAFNPEKWFKAIEDYDVSVWYSGPTAFRMLMGMREEVVKKYDLSSLRHILSVGEKLTPDIIHWGMNCFGRRIHDTWLRTETGAQVIANFPSAVIKPGSIGRSIPGIKAAIIDQAGNVLPPNQTGNLAIKKGWPSMMKMIWNNKRKYKSYFVLDDWYVSGDLAYMDQDGFYWIQGRLNEPMMTSGEKTTILKIENKLLEHPAIAEVGVIGKPDFERGEIIKAFIALKEGYHASEELKKEIINFVKNELTDNEAPQELEFKESIPKTRSGKILRRVLKDWELNSD